MHAGSRSVVGVDHTVYVLRAEAGSFTRAEVAAPKAGVVHGRTGLFYQANLGTLLRTCDAVGACMAVPATPHFRQALRRGNTLPVRSCVHWAHRPLKWLQRERSSGSTILAVELAEDAVRLGDLQPARTRTIVLLGHEHSGIPDEAWGLLHVVVEVPMVGVGASLNVAVAGSLVLYRLAGLS